MTHRQRFFALMDDQACDRTPFFPDITDWYKARRTARGEPQQFGTGQIIYDDDPFHRRQVDMPERFRDMTLLDFYRAFDWGCPIHAYDAFGTTYEKVTIEQRREGRERRRTAQTPVGTLETVFGMAPYGSEAIVRYPVKGPDDVAAVEYWARDSHYSGNARAVQRTLDTLGDMGVVDLPVGRTPFGLLVQELMGYEALAFALADDPGSVHRLLEALAAGFWERVKIAEELPGRVVIITDHADENLISPRWFEQYCLPYYQEAKSRLGKAGKLLSTHLDGNIRGLLGLLPEAGFDLLDGCTPSPMGNYEVEDLARVLGPELKTYCGVPSTLFATRIPTEDILAYGSRIVDRLSPNVVLNVGDVLPPDGDIDQVIALGAMVAEGG